ncbi:MAG: carboxypeptidase regulatory-like domain-containing protein [Silvibacterium sp.]|nr:carboxypeptidase regulatory-like domain-containing protein [Silvibacterium sp.]
MSTCRRHLLTGAAFAIVAALVLSTLTARAQSSSAALSGTVYDSTGAVVPGATVLLRNDASGDTRRDVSNPEGFFTFAAVPPATYSVTVEKQGFVKWEGRGITLLSNDNRLLSGIKLKPGSQEQTVVVQASSGQITPTDSGEKSFTIDEKIMQNVAIIGQNAAEFIKIMPGMAYTGGALNQSSYAASDERTGNGPVGSFSANGQRTGALDITSDGAHIIDPGCNCGQAMNTNQEMTQEVTVLTSNFGADSAKGPVVINTVGKSGGQQFHGEAYIYARYYALNANDWLGNNAGVNPVTGQQLAPRPETKYWYPGAQIGGPLFIPGTSFNKNRDKLFFFFATEYYKQNVDNGIYRAAVPTQAMRNGDFSDTTYLKSLSGSAIQGTPNGGGPSGKAYTNGKLNAGYSDPNGSGMMSVYPLPNANPVSGGANNGFNYINSSTRYSNMLQFRGRIDASINDSTKLFVSYNRQTDSAEESLDTLWTGNAQSWDDPTTPYPSPIVESTVSNVVTASSTKLSNPTLTNELIFNYVYLNLPNKFADPSKVARGTLGINYTMLFSHPNVQNLIYPEMTGWGNGISNQLNTGFELGGVVYAKKTLPSVADNISKVWKTHTAKFGFYWERTWNEQPGNGNVNGTAVYSNWGGGTSGNAYADMLIGQATQYSELNYNVVPAFRYIATEFYGMDSWKASRRLTIDYGMRVSHLGPWTDTTGYGFSAWYPDAYAANQGGSVNGATFPGIYWNKVHSSTSLAGSGSRLFFYNPRVGFAWDAHGNGETVVRGGYGIYHFHDEQNVQNGAYSIVQGSFSSPTLSGVPISNLPPLSGPLAAPGGITTLDPHDNYEPRTQSWSGTVAQRAPWRSLIEFSYLGSKSDYLSNWNNGNGTITDVGVGTLFNANLNPPGAVGIGWLANCDPSVSDIKNPKNCQSPSGNYSNSYTSSQQQNVRPFNYYSSIKIINHKMYSNYNALQVTWNKQQGHFIFLTNYTFSKALGIRGENGAPAGNPLNLKSDYGTLPNNRTHIFNIAYVYQFPNWNGDNALLKAVANNWQISGITQWQSGSDLQAAVTSNFNYSAFIPAGATYQGKTTALPIQASNQNVIGTPDITLMPKVICNPHAGLHSNQYVNGNCFAPYATPGQQGTYIFPTLEGPAYSGSDLSVFKNFTFGNSENRKLQFRFSGYNFMNHPIRTFTNGDPAFNLTFNSSGQLQQPVAGENFGTAYSKIGHRIIQGEMKFTF